MKIAVIGMGAIGSTYALHLVEAGHEVTAVARGARLQQLREAGAVVTVDGRRAAVTVRGEIDPGEAYDLVLVTVLGHQVDVLFPSLRACAARTVMFMFNTFAPLESLREVVGAERFAFGFPSIGATLREGRLEVLQVVRYPRSLSTSPAWARTFTEAKIPTEVPPDMEAWLRTHAAVVAPFMAAMVLVQGRGGGLRWDEAVRLADAMVAGGRAVRTLGFALVPSLVGRLLGARRTAAGLLWALSRSARLRALGAVGPGEPRALFDAMAAAVPAEASALLAVRP